MLQDEGESGETGVVSNKTADEGGENSSGDDQGG